MNQMQKFVEAVLARSRAAAAAAEAARPEIEAAEAKLRARASEALEAGQVRHLGACGVPEKLLAVFRDQGPGNTSAMAGAAEWLKGDKVFLVLTGGWGSGKSVAAAWTLLQARKWAKGMAHPLADEPVRWAEYDARRGLYITAAALHFAPRFTDDGKPSLLDRAATCEWLALDEFRAEDVKGAGLERFEEVLGERYAARRRTVITTNLPGSEVAALLGKKLASRFAEEALVVDTGDTDLRRTK